MLIALLIILAGVSYALGLWLNLRAVQHLTPGATLEEVRSLSKALSPRGAAIRNPDAAQRLMSLYTPRGWQLRRIGMLLLFVCVIAILSLIFQLVFNTPSIWHVFHTPSDWHVNLHTDRYQILWSVAQNKPSIFLTWLAALALTGLGFFGARFSPWLVIPIGAVIIIWAHWLTGIVPGHNARIVGTPAERSYAMQVMAGAAIALLATGQGMRYWAIRSNKRAERTPAAV